MKNKEIKKYRKIKYKKGERTEMLKHGFPLCVAREHCNSCIKFFRERQKNHTL